MGCPTRGRAVYRCSHVLILLLQYWCLCLTWTPSLGFMFPTFDNIPLIIAPAKCSISKFSSFQTNCNWITLVHGEFNPFFSGSIHTTDHQKIWMWNKRMHCCTFPSYIKTFLHFGCKSNCQMFSFSPGKGLNGFSQAVMFKVFGSQREICDWENCLSGASGF